MNLQPHSLPLFRATLVAGLICFSFLGQCALGQKPASLSDKMLALYEIKATPTVFEHEVVEAVFGKIYRVQEEVFFKGKQTRFGTAWMGVRDGKVFRVENRRVGSMPALRSLIRKDFRLRDKTDAETFLLALDEIFPPRYPYEDEDRAAREIIKTAGGWDFATHTSVNRKRAGFKVSTNTDGAITEVQYSRTIPLRVGKLVYALMTEAEQELIAKAFPDLSEDQTIQTIPSPIRHTAVDTVFGDGLFNVRVVEIEGRSRRTTSRVVALRAGKVLKIEETYKEMDTIPILRSLIRKDYRLRTEAEAETLLDALKVIYPPRENDWKDQEIIKTEDGWLIATGRYIRTRKGFLFSTNADGEITGIEFSTKIPEKEK